MVKTPDDVKQSDGLKGIQSDIKKREIKFEREESMELEHVVIEKDHPYATLRLRRSDDPNNTLSIEAVRDLRDALNFLSDDPEIKVLFLTGNDRLFSTGADVKQIQNLDPWAVRDLVRRGKDVFQRFEDMDCVTIALINGMALGGGLEMAMCCDFRIVTPKARLGLVEAKIGIIPGWGGTQRLPRLIGTSRALEMVYTGETIKPEEALKLGLVQMVIDKDQDLEEEGRKYAEKFTKLSKVSLMIGKRAVRTAAELPLWYGNSVESELFTLSWASKDREEGFKALFDKRKPEFKDE